MYFFGARSVFCFTSSEIKMLKSVSRQRAQLKLTYLLCGGRWEEEEGRLFFSFFLVVVEIIIISYYIGYSYNIILRQHVDYLI